MAWCLGPSKDLVNGSCCRKGWIYANVLGVRRSISKEGNASLQWQGRHWKMRVYFHCASLTLSRSITVLIPQIRWFKEQKCIFSQFLRLEVWDQGVGRVGSFWGWGRICSRLSPSAGDLLAIFVVPWLVDEWPSLASVFIFTCSCLCIQISSSYKDTSQTGLGDHPNDLILTWSSAKTVSK